MPKGTPLPQPRTWLLNDHDRNKFGRDKAVQWKQARSRSERALIAAAIVQHEFAKAVRAQLRRRNSPVTTTVELAAAADLTIDQLRRILRGEVPITLAHMHLIAAHAGLPVNNPGPDAPSPTRRRVRKETSPTAPESPPNPPVTNFGADVPSATRRRVRKDTPPVAPKPPTKPPLDPPRRHSATLLRTAQGYDAFDCCWGEGSLRLSVRNEEPLKDEEAETVEPPDAFNQIVTHLAAGQLDRVVTRLTTVAETEAAMVGLSNDLRASLKALNRRLPWLRLLSY